MKETKQFKTETKKLLDMMIHSIYSNKEIFLRELISNASDACDKRHFISLTNKAAAAKELKIEVVADKDNRTLTISDTGIGMDLNDLENNLGTIAKSGSKEFLESIENKKEVDIIGQFGVGFYSAFMIASEVDVFTKKAGSNKVYKFSSQGLEDYSIEEIKDDSIDGTKIVLKIRENTKDNKYDDYLDYNKIDDLIKKYSDYIKYPIYSYIDEYNEESKKSEKVFKVINSQKPVWEKSKKELKENELNEFYKNKFMDFQDPFSSILFSVEGLLTYKALIYIPKKPIFNMGNDKGRGLSLYSKGVFILDKCEKLLPEYLYFIKGLIDSYDINLNISRELIQEDRQILKIANNVEKKIIQELSRMQKNEREKYEEFFSNYGEAIKFGLYENNASKKDLLQDLVMIHSHNQNKLITFDEYVSSMKDGQKHIYFVNNKDGIDINDLPSMKMLKNKEYDVLVLKEDIDEFMLQVVKNYKDLEFKSITQGDLDLMDEDQKKEIDELSKDNKEILDFIKEELKNEVEDVIFSTRLLDDPFCITTKEGLSLQMEKVISKQNQFAKASLVLEINPKHQIFNKLKDEYNKNKDLSKKYIRFIYDSSMILEGFVPKNRVEFIKNMEDLILK